MSEKRTKIGRFIHSSWINMNIRCGKYKHLQTPRKNKVYQNIKIEFDQPKYKEWCYKNQEIIEKLERPSINRKDSNKNYSIDNIEVIELKQNIRQKRFGCSYLNGPKHNSIRGIRKAGNKWTARITHNYKGKHLGTFNTQEEALNAFKNEYFKLNGIYPF